MILLESGPAKTDRNYRIIYAVAFLAFAAFFFYDGAYRYQAKNLDKAMADLKTWTDVPENPAEWEATVRRLMERDFSDQDFERLKQSGPSREKIRATLGEPLPRKRGTIADNVELYVTRYGLAKVEMDPLGRVNPSKMAFQKWQYSKSEIQGQFYWAIIPLALALVFFWKGFQAARLHATIDEEGMTYGKLRIPMAAMVSLRDYSPKGWVDLYYQAGDVQRKLRIDNQKIAKFNEIITLLCDRRGFDDPVKVFLAAQPAKEHETTAADAGQEQTTATAGKSGPDAPAETHDTGEK